MKILTRRFGGFCCAAAVLSVWAVQAGAADYTYLLDVNTLAIGASVGESLTVKESCVDPNAANQTTCEKTKYVTALPGRTGRIEFPISVAGGSFDVSVNIDTNTASGGGYWGETLTVFSPDNSSLSVGLKGSLKEEYTSMRIYATMSCLSNNTQDTGLNRDYSSQEVLGLGYVAGYSSNDLRIGVQNGVGTCYLNNNPFVPGDIAILYHTYVIIKNLILNKTTQQE